MTYNEINKIRQILGLRKDDFSRKLSIFGINFLREMAERKAEKDAIQEKYCNQHPIMSPLQPVSAYGLCYPPEMYCMAYFMPYEKTKPTEPEPENDALTIGDLTNRVDILKAIKNL